MRIKSRCPWSSVRCKELRVCHVGCDNFSPVSIYCLLSSRHSFSTMTRLPCISSCTLAKCSFVFGLVLGWRNISWYPCIMLPKARFKLFWGSRRLSNYVSGVIYIRPGSVAKWGSRVTVSTNRSDTRAKNHKLSILEEQSLLK